MSQYSLINVTCGCDWHYVWVRNRGI